MNLCDYTRRAHEFMLLKLESSEKLDAQARMAIKYDILVIFGSRQEKTIV